MDRLLSELEITEIDNRHYSPSFYGGVVLNMTNARNDCIKAQLAKADKEWVEWIDKIRLHMGCGGTEYIAIPLSEWQERKKEIGL
jgi:hypothetical protein